MASKTKSAFADQKMLGRTIKNSFIKLNPKTQVQNFVMLLVYISAILTTGLWILSMFGWKNSSRGYTLAIAIILWFTCLFANFAEAIAEGRGTVQADSLRAAKKDVQVHKISFADQEDTERNCFADFPSSIVHHLHSGNHVALHLFHFLCRSGGNKKTTSITTPVALLVCLAPTTIGALLSAIGIALG